MAHPNTNESSPLLSQTSSQPTIITFSKTDAENPQNWAPLQKWLMVASIVPIDLSVSWGASAFSPASGSFAKDMHISDQLATLGLSAYILGLAFGPMSLAPLSEYFGRRPVYVFSYAIFLVFLLLSARVQSLGGFLVLRVLSGFFSSVTISNFGGTIADLFHHGETGPAMGWFLWAATGGSPTGFVLFSFIAEGRSWRDVFLICFAICAGFWVIMTAALYALGETRHSVILQRRAAKIRRQSGETAVQVPEDMKQRGPKQLFGSTLSRPFRFLFSEAIVQFGALYNGFLYGLSFLFNGAFHLIFGPSGYGYSTTGVGLSFLGIVVGISSGLLTNIYQERSFRRAVRKAGTEDVPEARVHLAKLASILLPISLLIFSITATPSIPSLVPILASALFGWSFYTLILMTLTYTEDSYKQYSASALAGIGLVRNIAGAAFPLFGRKMFVALGTRDAGLVLVGMSVVLVPIPFVLARYGKVLRGRSPWARSHEGDAGEDG